MNESLKNILGSQGGPQYVSFCGSQGLNLQHTNPTVARVKLVEQPQDSHYSHVQRRWARKGRPCPRFDSWVRKICWRRDSGLSTPMFLGFPCGSAGKESSCNAGDLGSIPGLGRSPGEGKIFWPGEFRGLYSPWGHKESDMTEQLSLHFVLLNKSIFIDLKKYRTLFFLLFEI